jgi:hypothetical protein
MAELSTPLWDQSPRVLRDCRMTGSNGVAGKWVAERMNFTCLDSHSQPASATGSFPNSIAGGQFGELQLQAPAARHMRAALRSP